MLGHGLSYILFLQISAKLLGDSDHADLDQWGGSYFLAWIGTALITLLLWFLAVVPRSVWYELGRSGLGSLGVSSAIGLAAWALGIVLRGLWLPLGRTTLYAVQAFLQLVVPGQVVYRPAENITGTNTFLVEMVASCSGYEGLGLAIVFVGAYLWFFRERLVFPRALLLLLIAIMLMWLANAFRISILILIGTWLSPEIAGEGFHSQAGWLLFNVVVLGILTGAERWHFFSKEGTESRPIQGQDPTAAYLGPMLSLVALTMLTRAFTTDVDWYYPIRILFATFLLWHFRRCYSEWRWHFDWQAMALGVLGFFLWRLLSAPISESRLSASGLVDDASPVVYQFWLATRVFGYVVITPLVEELAFRGYLTRRFINTDFQAIPLGTFSWYSFALSSLAFGLLHGAWLAGVVTGAIFALALYRKGRLADAILAHATTNGLLAVLAIHSGNLALMT